MLMLSNRLISDVEQADRHSYHFLIVEYGNRSQKSFSFVKLNPCKNKRNGHSQKFILCIIAQSLEKVTKLLYCIEFSRHENFAVETKNCAIKTPGSERAQPRN